MVLDNDVRINATIPAEIWQPIRQAASEEGLQHAPNPVVLRWALERFRKLAAEQEGPEPCTN